MEQEYCQINKRWNRNTSKVNKQKVITYYISFMISFGEKNRKIKKISYPTSLEEMPDIEDDNIDIFVELDDDMVYTMTVSIPKIIISIWIEKNRLYSFYAIRYYC